MTSFRLQFEVEELDEIKVAHEQIEEIQIFEKLLRSVEELDEEVDGHEIVVNVHEVAIDETVDDHEVQVEKIE